MTFRRETQSESSAENKKQQGSSLVGEPNDMRQYQVTEVSTIYNPRLQCAQEPSLSFTNIIPLFYAVDSQCVGGVSAAVTINNPRKTVIEKIKRMTLKLFARSKDSSELDVTQKKIRLIKFICLSILLTCKAAFMLAISVFILKSVQKPEIRIFTVDGEFQILNKNFEYEMLEKESVVFQKLAFDLTAELNRLFKKSDVSEYFQRSEILEITPNMTIKCVVIFHSNDNVNVGRIGLAFLRSLRLQHGHTYLGVYTINVQSIGFQIQGEEGVWGEWSDWTGCESPSDHVATRTRKCLTKDTLQVTNIDRCLLIPGNKSDIDILPCKKFHAMLQRIEANRFQRAILNDNLPDKVSDNLQLPADSLKEVVKSV